MGGVSCTDLTVTYGRHVAIDHVSLDVQPGEIYGLLGPNGAGKTSIIRALTTIVPIAGGTATVAGVSLDHPAQVRARIGVLPESNGYPTAQTARSYLRFHGQLFGLSRAESQARSELLLDDLGLADRPEPIATFSRGMRQRLGLCRALINEPDVLFLDEPTLGLDPAGQEEIMEQLTRLATARGTTVVLCSHLLDEIERVCDRVGILHRGRTVAEGRVADVIATSGVTGRGRITVDAAAGLSAADALERSAAADSITVDAARPGDIEFVLGSKPQARAQVLRSLLDAGIELRSFDLEGARLSTAFLALTKESR
jgi:ABC-2 type transport system ATP-binding protein